VWSKYSILCGIGSNADVALPSRWLRSITSTSRPPNESASPLTA
jgi:hypothetical protein